MVNMASPGRSVLLLVQQKPRLLAEKQVVLSLELRGSMHFSKTSMNLILGSYIL